MSTFYKYGNRDILTITPKYDVSTNDFLFYTGPGPTADSTHGILGLVCNTDVSAAVNGMDVAGCFMFDTSIAFLYGDPIFWHPQAGYWANHMHHGYFTDATTDIWVAVCEEPYKVFANSTLTGRAVLKFNVNQNAVWGG